MTGLDGVVYLVDDDASVREALSNLFASLCIDHITFASAEEYVRHPKPDTAACLILDLQLPGTNGLDVQRQLADEGAPPVIFISGHGDIPSTVRAMKAGAIEFLTKPVDSENLVSAICAGLELHRANRARIFELSVLRERFSSLTRREREVLPLVVGGMLNKQAAARLDISEVTLQVHRGQIMRKMCAGSLAGLVRISSKLGITGPDRPL
jgi:FixJ family two-component response regulator